MSAESTVPARRGRLTPEREGELLRITLEMVAEVGYDHVTMADVAKRTKCSTATLYRQWESKPRLVVSAWQARERERSRSLADVDTGTLRGDLMEVVDYLRDEDPAKESLLSLYSALVRDEELMRVLREVMIQPTLRDLGELCRRAVARGEIDADNRVLPLVEHMLLGPWLTEHILHGRQAPRALLESIVDAVLLPALTGSTERS